MGFTPPPYPFDRLDPLKEVAAAHEGGLVDLSVGTPCDPPPPPVVAALGRSGPVPVDRDWRLQLSEIAEEDAGRALCLWVNSPGNPTGAVDDLGAVAAWGRAHGVPVFSDECYVEFTWNGPGHSIVENGLDGLVAVHSLSKRSNLAGLRIGFYAGDGELVSYLSEVRRHAGLMPAG